MKCKCSKEVHQAATPRLIIHGGAGNITPANLPPDRYKEYRAALLTIVSKAQRYMTTPLPPISPTGSANLPPALGVATYAVTLLEDSPLFNSGHGAVFTRDGVNELEASVMVSRGRAKRGVGVSGLRRVRNPILLARAVLEHGEADLGGTVVDDGLRAPHRTERCTCLMGNHDLWEHEERTEAEVDASATLDVPSAQGHTLIFGAAAEQLAEKYGLEMVDERYFFTQKRWDEHIRALEREKSSARGVDGVPTESATWSATEFLPQGTCGAVALDSNGVICVATSTGGLTNKLTGRIGDTPIVGAGFWAEEWVDTPRPRDKGTGTGYSGALSGLLQRSTQTGILLSNSLQSLFADCLPTPTLYQPLSSISWSSQRTRTRTSRSMAVSGTGNGDSFMRTDAARTAGAMARFAGMSSAAAVRAVAGPGGELQKSAGKRWGKTGEGEGGMIGIESIAGRDAEGNVVRVHAEIIQNHNCGGMFRAWIDDDGRAVARIWREGENSLLGYPRDEEAEVSSDLRSDRHSAC